MDDLDKLQLEGELLQVADPLERYMRSLPELERQGVEQVVRMRAEFLGNASAMFVALSTREAVMRAHAVAAAAEQLAFRWHWLMVAVRRFVEREPMAGIVVKNSIDE